MNDQKNDRKYTKFSYEDVERTPMPPPVEPDYLYGTAEQLAPRCSDKLATVGLIMVSGTLLFMIFYYGILGNICGWC